MQLPATAGFRSGSTNSQTLYNLHLKPLPFAATVEFLPHYTAAERVAVYAILGGIPATERSRQSPQSLILNFDQLQAFVGGTLSTKTRKNTYVKELPGRSPALVSLFLGFTIFTGLTEFTLHHQAGCRPHPPPHQPGRRDRRGVHQRP
jgi:hypothetical protein